ncbi:MAG: histidine triad nucleotide-binding protein [Ignavibacteriae bacterium]|nr:histidine triad nucleotide-binding protein [Ignavibacteriota bacterium]
MASSIFTKIINREIPAKIEYEDELAIAFHDIQPHAPIHILIVPKKEIETLNQATIEDMNLLGHCLLIAKKLAVLKNIDKSGYRIVMNCNRDAGQTVFHLHFHLLGGKQLQLNLG